MSDWESQLPRDAGGRFGLGIVSFPFALFFGFDCFALVASPMPPLGLLGSFLWSVSLELLVVACAICALTLLWAVATPIWVEHLYRLVRGRLWKAILLAFLAVLVLAALGTAGFKPGDV